MNNENKASCNNNCYAIIALCISFLVLGLLIGNWIGKCQKTASCKKMKKCQSYSVDGKAGSTCTWSKSSDSINNKKVCATTCEKKCCKK